MNEKRKFIGYYNTANVITLLGLASAMVAIFIAVKWGQGSEKHIRLAVLFFLFSGLCDMFDGRIARGMGARTRKEKLFGIQIDTVCDMVSFGVAPVVIVFCAGFNSIIDIPAYAVYFFGAAIRLAYFNTQAVEDTPDLNMKEFTGVPVPASCLILPPIMILLNLFGKGLLMRIVISALFLITGLAFISNVQIKKMNVMQSVIFVIVEIACVTFMFIGK